MSDNKMNPEVKAEWLKALRSGEYEQGTGQLKRVSSDGPVYCCLGVLEDLAVKAGITEGWDERSRDDKKSHGYKATLSVPVMDWADLDTDSPYADAEPLYRWNDTYRKTFSEIADLIEEHL